MYGLYFALGAMSVIAIEFVGMVAICIRHIKK